VPYPYKGERCRDRRISSRSITAWGNARAPYPICRSAVVDLGRRRRTGQKKHAHPHEERL